MKRGAEDQLTKDNANEGRRSDDDDPGRGIVKANEQVLARREIRSLPKRSVGGAVATAPPPSTTSEAPKVSKFAGFTGFGSSAKPPSPFAAAFTAPTTDSRPTTSAFSGLPASNVAPPAVASGATKTFASFVGGSSLTSQPFVTPDSVPQDKMDEDSDDELRYITQYFKALRGLNRSFLSAVDEAVKSDAFVDLTGYLDHYKSLREKEQTTYDEATNANKKDSSSSSSAESAFDGPKTSTSMPAPPITFGGFSGFPPPTANANNISSSGSGFTFKPTTSITSNPSPFALPTASSVESKEAPKASFAFGGASSSASSSSPFLFGASSLTSPSSSNPFGAPSSSTPSIFGSNLFGGSSTANAKSEENKPSAGNSAASIFGGTSAFGNPPVSSPNNTAFVFGITGSNGNTSSASNILSPSADGESSGSAAAPLFAGFGKSQTGSGSLGNPVGFGFGSPSASSNPDPFAITSASSSSVTHANGSNIKENSDNISGSAGGSLSGSTFGSEEDTPTPTPDVNRDPAQLMKQTTSVHDTEGEGEEDEETIHQARSKVFKLGKNESGSQGWTDMGVGMLRLKKHKVTGARRLLLRNSSTGKIVINFNMYTGMTPSATKNTVSFVGHDNSELAAHPGSATPFKLRLKTEGEANQLKDALDRAIEFVPSKQSD